ncbi:MAG TPA: fructose-bisphosphatase class II [Galbitalea sp.]|nr:fructose-bisphosphatase class II [Galbitalea sp.]
MSSVLGGDGYARELVAALVRATADAAEASRRWWGHGDKNAVDAAAVAAMRAVLVDAPFDGTIVIGEGEKDAAPMLANGERLGIGGRAYDIAVDPLDGTRLVAEGLPGSIAVIALSPRGTMFDPVDVFYMDKLICSAAGRGVVDICRSVGENLAGFADATGRSPSDLVVAVLDKPRHVNLVMDIRATGATARLVGEGDVSWAVSAASGEIDFVLGIGGTPEGIVAACAVRALGGFMQARLAPQSTEQVSAALAAGHDLERILELDDLVSGDSVLFVSTAI